eukprot:759667-Rhodomonas_salina.1
MVGWWDAGLASWRDGGMGDQEGGGSGSRLAVLVSFDTSCSSSAQRQRIEGTRPGAGFAQNLCKIWGTTNLVTGKVGSGNHGNQKEENTGRLVSWLVLCTQAASAHWHAITRTPPGPP